MPISHSQSLWYDWSRIAIICDILFTLLQHDTCEPILAYFKEDINLSAEECEQHSTITKGWFAVAIIDGNAGIEIGSLPFYGVKI